MAGIVQFRNVQKLMTRLRFAPTNKVILQEQATKTLNLCRAIGTSSAKKETDHCSPKPKVKPWVSWGYSDESEFLDRMYAHLVGFVGITLVVGLGSYFLMYLPDYRNKDWALREAYLVLRRREGLGLPPIDPNLIDPAKVKLPTDEELGDTEIII